MRIRVVQIWGFLMTILGWILVACTLAMESWKVTAIGGQGGSSMIKVAWYWSSLWRSCFRDSTSVTNCYDFPVLWSVDGHIQIVRGLLMSALCLGMLGFVLSLMGMECTYIGGQEMSKYRKIYTGGWFHVISGALSTSGYGVYAQYVSGEYFNPTFDGLRFNLGTPLFLGWVGSAFHMLGGCFYLWSVCNPLCGGKKKIAIAVPSPKDSLSTEISYRASKPYKTKVYSVSELSSQYALSEVSGISSRPKRSFKLRRSTKMNRSTRSRPTPKSDSTSDRSARSASPRPASYSMSSESMSSESSRSSESRTSDSRTASSLSSRSRSEFEPFTKNTYI